MEDNVTIAPTWLDKEFVEKVIRENNNNPDIVVTRLDIGAVVGKGDNFASQLCRATVQLRDGDTVTERRLIVKSLPAVESIQKLLLDCCTFEREMNMYQVTLPAMSRLLADSGCSLPSLSAESYLTTRPRTVIMEDLSARGYVMANKREGMDTVQTHLGIRALARFHAASIVLLRRDPSFLDMYHENYYCDRNREWLATLYKPMLKALISQVSSWPGLEHFAEKLRKVLTVSNIIAFIKPYPTDSIVLNHGDPWLNNLLFQISPTGETTSVKFVDFQEMRLASPAMDLQYFLYSGLRKKMCAEQWRDALCVYHKELVATLRMCGEHHVCADMASVEALEKKMDEKILFGLLTAATILPIAMADATTAPDFDKWEEDEEGGEEVNQAAGMYLSPQFREIFEDLLPHFEAKGAFQSHRLPSS